MIWPFTCSLSALMSLRAWVHERKKDCFARPICSLHLVIAYVQAVWRSTVLFFSLLVLGYPQTAVWIHCCCHGAYHLDRIFIPHFCSGGYLKFDRAFWTGPGSRREEFCIYHGRHLQRKDLHTSVHRLFHRSIPEDIFEPSDFTDLQD